MSENEFYQWWTVGFTLGGAVVVIAATLLIVILLVARKIAGLAGAALGVAGRIKAATLPIWSLADANNTAEAIVRTVQSIDARVTRIADALAPRSAGGRGASR
jgi:hypothetical protein